MNIVPFEPAHADRIDLQEEQCKIGSEVTSEELARAGDAFTGMIGDEVLFCAGRVRQWQGRWLLWAMLSKDANKYMLQITRAIRRLIDLAAMDGRLEVIVRSGFEEGHRWAKILGMRYHHHEERFLPDGSDADIYVRM